MTAGLAVQQVVYDMERTIGHRYTGTKKHNSCSRCQCLLCGSELIAMNHPHAIAHGFKDNFVLEGLTHNVSTGFYSSKKEENVKIIE